MISSLLPAIYPLLKESYHLDFAEVGLITLTYQCTASLLQPLVGLHTDRRPMPYSLPAGMGFTLVGLVILSMAHSFGTILFAAALVGTGASVFHPESSRVARMASGGQHGLAQSLFQLGGNAGLALGPLLAAVIVLPRGQPAVAWFTLAVLLAIVLLSWVSRWTKGHMSSLHASLKSRGERREPVSGKRVVLSITVLLALLFSKFFYLASITSYYTFYLMGNFTSRCKARRSIFLCSSARWRWEPSPVGQSATALAARGSFGLRFSAFYRSRWRCPTPTSFGPKF